ncbi:hypothetical protein [Sphingobacterium sp.]|uniref:hypothetical protein n=1 Tax=Sphingobacterium sp. TaxID=341027 RepID=UPI002FDCC364
MTKDELLKAIKENGYTKFTSKRMQELINKNFAVPKSTTKMNIQQLYAEGMIIRKYSSTSCSTLCASCMEYGVCDADPQPPISYYQIV